MVRVTKKDEILWEIKQFSIMFSISAFTFGGGYVVIPMMRKYFVSRYHRFSEEELMDMAAVAQSAPGAIAVNLAVLAGFRMSGKKGAAASCIGTVLPPLIILAVISSFYAAFRDNMVISAVLKGMEAGVASIIVDLFIDMTIAVWKEKNRLQFCLVPAAFIASACFHINAIVIILCCAAVSFLESSILAKKQIREEREHA